MLFYHFTDNSFSTKLLNKYKAAHEKQVVFTLDSFNEKIPMTVHLNSDTTDVLMVNPEDYDRAQRGNVIHYTLIHYTLSLPCLFDN